MVTTQLDRTYADESGHRHRAEHDLRKTLLAGVIGGVVAAASYFIYNRLEEDQKDAIRQTVGKIVQDKVSEVRSQLKF